IHFNISTDDDGFDGTVWTIRPQSQLPEINDGVVIDGTTQAINQEDTNEQGPEIVLNGRDLEDYTSGLRILSADNVITGLVIGGFGNAGIYMGGSSTRNNIISGNYIGTTATGDDTLGNLYGIFMTQEVTHTLIGGYEPDSRNVISGNHNDGIVIRGDSNTVVNNYIGVDVSGSSRLSNEDDGIYMYTDARENQIGGGGVSGRNVISGNNGDGIYIDDGTGNRIQGNYIGLNAAGNDFIPNHYGVYISCNHNIIGGSGDTEGNIISGNEGYGIFISNADSNEVGGNIIGTNAEMDTIGGNGYSGISLYNAQGNNIGGENPQQGNIIINNNSEGIILSGLETENNIISRNYIGVDPDGEKSLPNGWEGIKIRDGASNNTIGPANVIAYNLQEGIVIQDSASVGNTITRNSIYNNREKGISLLYDANQNIQKPIIQVGENVSGTAPALSTVEIFSGPDEEGKDFEGSATANEAGTFIWEGTPTGSWVTATATDMAGNTSEFSAAWLREGIVVTTTADSGEGSLRWALTQSNLTGQADTIWFNISEDDDNFDGTVWRIAPQTELPALTGGGTVIYGLSQKDNQSDSNPEGPEIFLDGSEIMESSFGLRISSSHNAICGVVISGFQAGGLILEGEEVKHNHVYANFIGTTPAGDDTLKNDAGVYILWGAGRNRIGG
ncbi:MAG: NosD domain-containing protein, partial [bacterium]